MAALTERLHATHVVAELGGERSRDTVTIAAGPEHVALSTLALRGVRAR